MTDRRNVTFEGWKAALVDELLFRAASELSDRGVPDGRRSVRTELHVDIAVDPTGTLRLSLDSVVDGEVTTSLAPPF